MTISPFVNVGNIHWVWKGERWQIKWVNLLLVVTKESSDSLFGNGRDEPPAFSFLLLTNSGSQGTASVGRAMSKFYCLPFYFQMENIMTLLCYLEAHEKQWVNLKNPCYAKCNIRSVRIIKGSRLQ